MMDATVLLSIFESWDLIKSYVYGYNMIWFVGSQKKELRPEEISRDATQNKAVRESCRGPFLAGEHSPVVQENLENSHLEGVHHHHLAEHYLQMQNCL